jgi:hypothetical protein
MTSAPATFHLSRLRHFCRHVARGLVVSCVAVLTVTFISEAAGAASWTNAWQQGSLSAADTRAFMRQLAQFVFDHHLKTNAASAQRGMIYEYFDTTRAGQPDRWVQGEALDTMHDGAWFAAALVNAYRATGDPFYKEMLTRWVLPFYVKMLNHSDTLFHAQRDDARTNAHRFNREHQLQEGENGFVPYWWDDGASVSLERRRDRNPRGPYSCTDCEPAASARPDSHRLCGYSHGSSNHLAQDLAVMLELAWLLLRDSPEASDKRLAAEVAEAALNLHQSRLRHHGHIPMVDAASGMLNGDAALLRRVPAYDVAARRLPANHAVRALFSFVPGRREAFPGFADDQQYLYYGALAKHGTLPPALAFKLAYDALVEPMLFHFYSDDAPLVPGINRFDLHPFYARDGKLEDYRSDRKGPFKGPRPIGSRMGPQNMIVAGWALQALNSFGDLWEERVSSNAAGDQPVFIHQLPPGSAAMDPTFARFRVGNVTLGLSSTRRALTVRGDCAPAGCQLKLFQRPDATGAVVIVTINGEGHVRATNGAGDELVVEAVESRRSNDRPQFAFTLPYAAVKEQGRWWTALPHLRGSVQADGIVQNLYFTSEEEQVKRWLAWELGGGLRTWQAIFREKGFIPTGMNAGAEWDRFSDSGGYAHLISAGAQWIFVLEGKRDWEQHGAPQPR